MKITFDKNADAVYVYLKENSKVVSTQGEWPFNVDIDKGGEVVGIEIMEATNTLNQALLERAEDITSPALTS